MRGWILLLAAAMPCFGQEPDLAPEDVLPEVPKATEVISEKVATLPPPKPPAITDAGVKMAITASSKEVEQSVRYGMHCLQTGWDFEAYRHFCMAVNGDSDCLMAHWGIGMSLLHGSDGLQEELDAAMTRMLALVDKGVGTELEKRYVFGLVNLLTKGTQEAANAFSAAAEEFPGDPQIVLFKSLLGRGGYDALGDPTPDELRAEKDVFEQTEKHPDASYLKYAYLAMKAEAASLEDDLPMARKLCEGDSEYAPYFHLLGHYEWRCGNHSRAAQAFGRAADLYAAWMKATGLKAVDCALWTKAESYRAVALASKGEYETALAVADGIAAIPVPLELAHMSGARMLMWEGKTLPVRILMKRGKPGDMKRAAGVLPSLDSVKGYGKKSLALWSYQVHSSAVAGRLALENGELDTAREVTTNITGIGENFVRTREIAAANGERSHWLRAFKAFEVMASELRGLTAMAGPDKDRGSAFNWYSAAADRQVRSSLMMPPSVLLPMEYRLAEYYEDRDEPNKAIESLLTGLDEYPNDWELLNRLKALFAKQGMKDEAAEVAARIEAMLKE
ncbi:TPR repeat-containing protein [Haloferula helveola]|uniref:TPR repeat-containing protein n=1 Tax=Haloferula helveola TaxID=490095 RepID=A0ABM7R938_9BACT|nr:TPR repeat-containing protein [Haloferula helveola]